GEFLRKLFEIVMGYPEGVQGRDALAALREKVNLTEYEKGNFESGGSRFEKIVLFATVDCVKAGWLLKQKGNWVVTDQGKEAYKAFSDPEVFYKEAVKRYNEWKASQPGAELASDQEIVDTTSGKSVSITFEQAEEESWREISQYLHEMNPYDFQDLV